MSRQNKQQIDLFTGDAPIEHEPVKIKPGTLVNIWQTNSGKACMIVLREAKLYLYHCPCCGYYNDWDKIITGQCWGCKAKEKDGFSIDRIRGLAIPG